MQKDDLVFVGHMLDLARKCLKKVQRRDRLAFDRDENLRLALAHLIQMIGEAARNVSVAFRKANPAIPWQDIAGMRSKIVHDYMDVDYDIVWDVATLELSPLVAELQRIVPPDDLADGGCT